MSEISLIIRALEDYEDYGEGDKEEFVEEWLREYYCSRAEFIENYENDPMVQAGWANEDACFNRYRER